MYICALECKCACDKHFSVHVSGPHQVPVGGRLPRPVLLQDRQKQWSDLSTEVTEGRQGHKLHGKFWGPACLGRLQQPCSTTTMLYHNHALPQPCSTTTMLYHNHALPQPCSTTTMLYHNHALQQSSLINSSSHNFKNHLKLPLPSAKLF